MSMTIEERLRALQKMSSAELKQEFRVTFGEDPRSGNVQWMRKRLAWGIQAEEYGGLSAEAERRIQELIPEALKWLPFGLGSFPARNAAGSPVKRRDLNPGTVLTRRFKGRTIEVLIREDGHFEYAGQIYRSLTAVAAAVTGAHWSGTHFFRLPRNGKRESA